MASCAAPFSRGSWGVFSKKICPAESSIRDGDDGLWPRVAGNVVVQIQSTDGFLCRAIFAGQLVSVFEEDMPGRVLDPRFRQKRQIESGDVSNPERLRQLKAGGVAIAEKNCDAIDQ